MKIIMNQETHRLFTMDIETNILFEIDYTLYSGETGSRSFSVNISDGNFEIIN